MVCGSIVDQDDFSNRNASLPSLHRKMNGIHTVETRFSYRYPSAVSKLTSPSFITKNLPRALCIFAFACSCLHLSAVSAEQNSAYPNSTNTLKTDASYNSKPGCTNCNKLDLETLANITLQQIKSQILHRLGFTHGAPNITNLPSKIPPVDLLYTMPSFDGRSSHHKSSHIRHESSHGPANMQNDEAHSYDDSFDEMKTHMVIAKAKEVNYGPGYPKRPLQFTFDSFSKVRVTSARLLLYQRPVLPKDQYAPRTYKLTVNKIPAKGPTIQLQHFESTLEDAGGWITFEFKADTTAKLFSQEDSDSLSVNLILHARFLQQNITGEVPLITDMKKCDSSKSGEADCTNVPYLKLEIEEPKIRRNKRSTYPECWAEYDDCCRYSLIVDFEELKWDFIIAPKKYNAHYCAGECSFSSSQRHPHTHVTMMSQGSNPSFRPCCGPRSMSSIAMLYFNKNNNIVFGMLPGMIVDRCGCS